VQRAVTWEEVRVVRMDTSSAIRADMRLGLRSELWEGWVE
jgi:hypothetical protein